MNLYAIQAPAGGLIPETLSESIGEPYWKLFHLMEEPFQTKFWKRQPEGRRAMKRRGYRSVRVRVRIELAPRPRKGEAK